jgi:hypothetical protein
MYYHSVEMLKGCALAVLILVAAPGGIAPTQTAPEGTAATKHSVTVKFDYDFHTTHACSKRHKADCVRQFVVYDISAGEDKRTQLFTIPTPRHAKKSNVPVTGTSPQLLFESGQHLLEVVAQYPDGTESAKRASTTWVTIP